MIPHYLQHLLRHATYEAGKEISKLYEKWQSERDVQIRERQKKELKRYILSLAKNPSEKDVLEEIANEMFL